MLRRVYYGPSDWLGQHTTARGRRAFSIWVTIFWLGPGLAIWLWLRNDLWFVGLMSIVALHMTGITMVGTETPTESESLDG